MSYTLEILKHPTSEFKENLETVSCDTLFEILTKYLIL